MELTKNKVAVINYTLKDKDNNIMDQSNNATFTYLHGADKKNLIPALEEALEGKQAGDTVNAVIKAENAYGMRNEELIQRMPKKMFPVETELKVGMPFRATSPDQSANNVVIVAIEEEEVVVDGNHPLAGVDLHFEIELIEVRDATEEEIEHGHVHGPGGHEH